VVTVGDFGDSHGDDDGDRDGDRNGDGEGDGGNSDWRVLAASDEPGDALDSSRGCE
jgi:hypothetical protein